MVFSRRHFVPNPVPFSTTGFRAKCKRPLSIHTRYDDTGLAQGTLYYYDVQAANGVGSNSAATFLATPTALQVTAISGSAVSLQWVGNSADESGYSVEQLTGAQWQEIAWTDPDATTATVEGTFEPLTEYAFRVQACSDASAVGRRRPLPSRSPAAWPDARPT